MKRGPWIVPLKLGGAEDRLGGWVLRLGRWRVYGIYCWPRDRRFPRVACKVKLMPRARVGEGGDAVREATRDVPDEAA